MAGYNKDKHDTGILRQDGVTKFGLVLARDKYGAPQYAEYDDEYLAAQFFTSTPGYSNLPADRELAFTQDDWRAGFGQEIYDSAAPSRFFKSRGMDTRFKGMMIPGPKASPITVNYVWTAPTNYQNPGGWVNTAKAIDGDWASMAQVNVSPADGWSALAYFTMNATNIACINWMACIQRGDAANVAANVFTPKQINVGYYDTAWHDLFQGNCLSNAANSYWIETPAVTNIRVKIYTDTQGTGALGGAYLAELSVLAEKAGQDSGVHGPYAEFNDKLYWARNSMLYRKNVLNTGFIPIKNFAANITALEPFTDNKMYVALNYTSITNVYQFMETNEAFNTAMEGYNTFRFMKTVHSSAPTMWANDGNATIRSNLTPSNANSWSSPTIVSSNYHNITGLLSKSGSLYIMKEDMPYYLDSTGAVKNDLAPELASLTSPTSGKNPLSWLSAIYIQAGEQALLEYDNGVNSWRTPADRCTNLPEYNGKILAMTTDDRYIYLVLENGGNVEVVAAREEEVDGSTQWIYHDIAQVPINGCETAFIGTIGGKKLWLGSALSNQATYHIPLYTGYADILNDPARSFQSNTELITSWIHFNFKDTTKAVPRVSVLLGHNYNASVFFDGYYQKKNDTAWTSMGQFVGNADSRIATNYLPSDSSGNKPKSTMIRFKWVANTAYTDKAPVMLGYNVQGLLYPSRRNIISCVVRCAHGITLKGGEIEENYYDDVKTVLDEARDAAWPVTFYDIDGIARTVKFLPLPRSTPRWKPIMDEKGREKERQYNLLMQCIDLG